MAKRFDNYYSLADNTLPASDKQRRATVK